MPTDSTAGDGGEGLRGLGVVGRSFSRATFAKELKGIWREDDDESSRW